MHLQNNANKPIIKNKQREFMATQATFFQNFQSTAASFGGAVADTAKLGYDALCTLVQKVCTFVKDFFEASCNWVQDKYNSALEAWSGKKAEQLPPPAQPEGVKQAAAAAKRWYLLWLA
jgi:hypothetical protein